MLIKKKEIFSLQNVKSKSEILSKIVLHLLDKKLKYE